MHRILLNLLVVLSLAIGGFANASAAQDCRYLKAVAGVHDCCPNGVDMPMKVDGSHHAPMKKGADCLLGQACRTAIAVSPSLPQLQSHTLVVDSLLVLLRDDRPAPSTANAFWRPPRVI